MHERHLLDRVRHLAQLTGWRTYHTHDSRRSEPGFPDLVLVRGPHLIFAELKGEAPRGRLTPPQADWLAALSLTSHVTAEVWRPADWPRIANMLRRNPLLDITIGTPTTSPERQIGQT